MSTAILVLLFSIPLIGVFWLLGTRQRRREAQAMRDFAALLEKGSVTPGQRGRGPRATGRWKGTDVSVGFFGRMNPPVFLTAVTASRHRWPLAALLVPRTDRSVPRREPQGDAPGWIVALDRIYDAGCAPRELFRAVIDESTARSLIKLESTEVELLPANVNVQRREVLYDAAQLVPLLDAAVQLVARLDSLQEQLGELTEDERLRRTAEVMKFLNAFQSRN